ncbi:MAG: hypothetical protein ACRDZO_00445 [Egibacteraceae bacterium]
MTPSSVTNVDSTSFLMGVPPAACALRRRAGDRQDPPGPPYWLWRQVARKAADAAGRLGDGDLAPLVMGSPAGAGLDAVDASGPLLGAEAGGGEDRVPAVRGDGQVLRQAAAGEGLVVVLDDLHWAGRPSVLLLRHLVRQWEAGGARVLVLATYRDTDAVPGNALGDLLPDLVAEPATERLRLRGLVVDAVGAYLGLVSGGEDPDLLPPRPVAVGMPGAAGGGLDRGTGVPGGGRVHDGGRVGAGRARPARPARPRQAWLSRSSPLGPLPVRP